MALRSTVSGFSFATQLLSKIMVGHFSAVNLGHVGRPGWLGLPVRAKVDPGGGDFLGEGLGFGAVAGHVFGAGLVVKAEGNFGAVERAGARVEDGRLPLEPIDVCGSAALRGFAFALCDGALADGRGHHAGINVERFFAGMLIVENFQNLQGRDARRRKLWRAWRLLLRSSLRIRDDRCR